VFVGRRRLLEKCRLAVEAGQNVWLWGEHGVGKTALAKRAAPGALYLPHSSPPKELLSSLLLECWRRGWHTVASGEDEDDEGEEDEGKAEKKIRRLDQKSATAGAVAALRKAGEDGTSGGEGRPLLILDDFDQAPASSVRVCRALAGVATLLACGVAERPAQRPFLFGFEKVEVARLSRAEGEQLASRLLDEFAIAARERPSLLRYVVEQAQGLPLVAHELVARAARRGDVSLRGVRGAGVRGEGVHGLSTVDMTPGLVIGACVLLGLRYALRGLGDADLTVMAGVAAAAFTGLRFYAGRLSKPSRSGR